MTIAIVGDSHAPGIFRQACEFKMLVQCPVEEAEVVIVAEDTPVTEGGGRNLSHIHLLVSRTVGQMRDDATLVLTSQVPPGFTRSLGIWTRPAYHQSETLRIKDALERALNPEQMIVGCEDPRRELPRAYRHFLEAFDCPIWRVTYETAEFSKIAINMMLAAQVDRTNELSQAAEKCGASWVAVAEILKLDKRIGPHAYLEPGRWQDSLHLLRDYATMMELLK